MPLFLVGCVLGTFGDVEPALSVLKEAQRKGHRALLCSSGDSLGAAQRAGVPASEKWVCGCLRAWLGEG